MCIRDRETGGGASPPPCFCICIGLGLGLGVLARSGHGAGTVSRTVLGTVLGTVRDTRRSAPFSSVAKRPAPSRRTPAANVFTSQLGISSSTLRHEPTTEGL